jgi:hypothetical protein
VGLTEVQVRKFLALLTRKNGLSGIFSFPDTNMQGRNYNSRIKPILDSDKIFNPDMGAAPVRNKHQIQILQSFGYVTGCSDSDATSTPADFLMHDEVDLSDQEVLSLYQSRLQNSDMKVTQKFSTPTWDGFGIDRSYALSDKREYFCKCPSCGHQQIPLFTPQFVRLPGFREECEQFEDLPPELIAGLNVNDAYVVCERCSSKLDLGNPELRQWVATHPGREAFRGYQVRPFSTSRLPASYLFKQLAKHLNEGTIRHFKNTVLGEPHSSSDSKIQEIDIRACMKDPKRPQIGKTKDVFLGLDIGFTCYLTLSFDDENGSPVFFHWDAFPYAALNQKVTDIRKVYNIIQGAADRFPFEPTVDALRLMTNNLIMPVQYRGTAALTPTKDELGAITHYSANNTYVLDRIHAMITQHAVTLLGYESQQNVIITHLTDNVRDERPQEPAVWRKSSGEDHYFHSMAFNMLARRIREHNQLREPDELPRVCSAVVAAAMKAPAALGANKGASRISRLGAR